MTPGFPRSLVLALLSLLVLTTGCKTTGTGDGTEDPTTQEYTEVTLEAPTAPPQAAPVRDTRSQAEVAELRAQNNALQSELDRLQAKNRAWAMETARLREEVIARPTAAPASPPPATYASANLNAAPPPAAPAATTVDLSPGNASDPESFPYTIQTASYSDSAKGRKAAEKLVSFFESKGFAPAKYRASGKYLIVLVGGYGSHGEAKSARSEIAQLSYFGRKGDFATSTIRKN